MSKAAYLAVARGNLSDKSPCFIPGARKCKRKGKWLVFPRGPGTLDTTQFSNLHATPCDKHLIKALDVVKAGDWRKS